MAAPEQTRPFPHKLLGWPAAVVLLATYWLMATTGVANKSATFDEPVHITSGYSQWIHGDFRLEPAFRTIPNRWAALPLLGLDLDFPELTGPEWSENRHEQLADRFFYGVGNDPARMLRYSRAAMALLGAALGLLVYVWSRRLFGTTGGLLSLFLFAFSPTLLAHGPLASSDVAAALFLTLSVFLLWRVLHELTPWRLAASAFAVSALLLTKVSGLLIVPMGLLLALVRLASSRPVVVSMGKQRWKVEGRDRVVPLAAVALVHLLVLTAAIWTAFGFRYSSFNDELPGEHRRVVPWEEIVEAHGVARPLVETARRYELLPEAWLYGLSTGIKSASGRRAFFNGRYGTEGWTGFFPYALAVKTPLPLFAVLILAPLSMRRGKDRRGAVFESLYRTAPLWILLLVFWSFAIASDLNIGHRHILATYPSMFVLAGAALAADGDRWRKVVVALAALLFAASSLSIRPHYLAYFNFLAGGPSQAYRHLVDSSLDWGQDLPGLKTWLDENVEPGTPVYLSYFGSARPEAHGIEAVSLPGMYDRRERGRQEELAGGVYCISATSLQRVYTDPMGDWTAEHERLYRRHRAAYLAYVGADAEEKLRLQEKRDRGSWTRILENYRELRFARLCTYLLQREPDATVGYSILIYRLSDEQVAEALEADLS